MPLKVKIKPVVNDCRGCVIRGSRLCEMCASLVEDASGLRYVALRPMEGDRWRKVDMSDLIGAPEVLQQQE